MELFDNVEKRFPSVFSILYAPWKNTFIQVKMLVIQKKKHGLKVKIPFKYQSVTYVFR